MVKNAEQAFSVPLGVLSLMSLFTDPIEWPQVIGNIQVAYEILTNKLFDYTFNFFLFWAFNFKLPQIFIDIWILITLVAMALKRVADRQEENYSVISPAEAIFKKVAMVILFFLVGPFILAVLSVMVFRDGIGAKPVILLAKEVAIVFGLFLFVLAIFHNSGAISALK